MIIFKRLRRVSKKRFLVLCLLTLLPAFATAQAAEQQESSSFSQELQVFVGGLYPSTISNDYLEGQCLYFANWQTVNASAGIGIARSRLDLTGTAVCLPYFLDFSTENKKLILGFEERLHYTALFGVSSKIDFLSGIDLSFVSKNDFSVQFKLFYLLKASKIYSIKDLIIDNEAAFSLLFKKQYDAAFIQFGMSSYDYFYYPKAVAPVWMISFGHKINDNINGEIGLNFRYIDMFTLSSYLESAELKLGVGVKL